MWDLELDQGSVVISGINAKCQVSFPVGVFAVKRLGYVRSII